MDEEPTLFICLYIRLLFVHLIFELLVNFSFRVLRLRMQSFLLTVIGNIS